MKFTYRKKGLPMRLKRIPGDHGIVAACNIHVGEPTDPAAKVAVFKNCRAMNRFYREVLPGYRNAIGMTDRLGRTCRGFVNKLAIENLDLDTLKPKSIEVDHRFFCFVGLVEGYLTAEILGHEATHVGFAWDYRTRGKGCHADPHNEEENVCYPAGIFLNHVLTFIKEEKLREL